MDKKRIQVYADPETKRRIELAAAKHDISVTEYCLDAIMEHLVEDDIMEREAIEIPVKAEKNGDILDDLRDLHKRILARRGGEPIDIDIVNMVREERDDELLGLYRRQPDR